jgi:multidrug efflux pump
MVLAMNIDFFSRTVQIGAPSTQWWRQLCTAIVFGLTFATLLTLLVTPSALMVRENLKQFSRRWLSRKPQPETAAAESDRDQKGRGKVQEAAE